MQAKFFFNYDPFAGVAEFYYHKGKDLTVADPAEILNLAEVFVKPLYDRKKIIFRKLPSTGSPNENA